MKPKLKIAATLLSVSLTLATAAGFAADNATPSAVYKQYHKALMAATSVDQLSSFLCKKVNEDIQKTAPDVKPMMFGMIKDMTPKAFDVVSENIDGDHASIDLAAQTSDPAPNSSAEKSTGKVTFVREGGSWKIDKERWESKVENTGSGDAPKAPDIDKPVEAK